MDAIVPISDDSVKSFQSTLLADLAQNNTLLDCSMATVVQGECKGFEHHQLFPLQNPLSSFDKDTLVQNTIYILSQEMFLGSTYDYTINSHENSHLCTVSVQKRLAPVTNLHRPWEETHGSSIRLFNANSSSSVLQLSDLLTLQKQCPPPAHRRSTFPTISLDIVPCHELPRKPQSNQNLDNMTITQQEPFDLTTKHRQCIGEASFRTQGDNVHVASEPVGELHFSSDNQVQQDINLDIISEQNLNEKLQNHPLTFDESISSCISSVYGDKSTQYRVLHFCICGKQTEYIKSEIVCSCLNSENMHFVPQEDIPKNVTAGKNAEQTSISSASDIIEAHNTSQNDQMSQSNECSNETMFPTVCQPNMHNQWGETFIVVSDTESDNSSPCFCVRKSYSVQKPKTESELQTVNSQLFVPNSNKKSSLPRDTIVTEQNPLCQSSKEALGRSYMALPKNNLYAINKYVYDDSQSLSAECGTQNTHYPHQNESEKALTNMPVSSQMDTKIFCENKCLNMLIERAVDDCNVSAKLKSDSKDDSAYLSDAYYSDTDSDISLCDKKKLSKAKTNRPPLATWSVINMTQSHPLASLKIKLCRTSQQTADTVEAESRSITDRLFSAPEGLLHLGCDSRANSRIELPVTQDEEGTFSCTAFPNMSEIRTADTIEADSRSITDRLFSASEGLLHAGSDSSANSRIERPVTEDKEGTFSCTAFPKMLEISHPGRKSQLIHTLADFQKSSTPSSTPHIAKTEIFNPKACKVIGTDNHRSGPNLLPKKQHKCQETDTVFNMGFLVGKGKTRKAYFDEVGKNDMKSLSFRYSLMSRRATETDKISSHTTKNKKTVLQFFKHKLFSEKSNEHLHDLSSEKYSDHIPGSTKQHISRFHGGRNSARDDEKIVTRKECKTADLLNLQDMTMHYCYYPPTESASSKLGTSRLLSFNCKSEPRQVSQQVNVLPSAAVKLKTSLRLLLTEKLGLKLSDSGKRTAVSKDFSSPVRKRNASKNMSINYTPPTIYNDRKSVTKTKVACNSRVKDRSLETSDYLQQINENKSDYNFDKSAYDNALLLNKSDFSNRRRLTVKEIFKVKRQSKNAAELLATFMHDRTARKLFVDLPDEITKETLFFMCTLCSIKVSISDPDHLRATLHKLKNSRLPTESDIRQVNRRIRRQQVHEQ